MSRMSTSLPAPLCTPLSFLTLSPIANVALAGFEGVEVRAFIDFFCAEGFESFCEGELILFDFATSVFRTGLRYGTGVEVALEEAQVISKICDRKDGGIGSFLLRVVHVVSLCACEYNRVRTDCRCSTL